MYLSFLYRNAVKDIKHHCGFKVLRLRLPLPGYTNVAYTAFHLCSIISNKAICISEPILYTLNLEYLYIDYRVIVRGMCENFTQYITIYGWL